jgi:hypothetical protein
MSDPSDLRKKAALCRKAANVRTIGDGGTDRLLTEMAERLESQAEEIERGARRRRSTDQ